MAVRLSTGLKNFALDSGLATAFDGGTGRINVYTGTQPATADTAASGTLLATLTINTDSFAAASSGAIVMNSATSGTAVATGTAGYVRFYRTGDTAPASAGNGTTDRRLDLLIATDISIDNASVVTGGTVALSGYTLTHA